MKEARNYAQISLAKASELNSQYYRGAAKANLCWVELEEGQTALAQGYGLEALKVWEGGNYPFLWLALFPLARIALQEDRTREAAGYLVVLLNIVQQRMPADIEKTLEALAFASSENNWIAAERLAQQAVEQARSMGYL